MKSILILVLGFFATSAHASPGLPYCRTLVSGFDRAGNLFFAEAPVQNFKEFERGDLKIYYVLAVNGGQLDIEENNEIALRVNDSTNEYRAHANGDLSKGGILTLDLNLNGNKTRSNVCFGAVEAILVSCSYQPWKVDKFMNRILNEPELKHTLPDCGQ